MPAARLNPKTDSSHELQSVALLDDAATQTVVESHFSILETVFEVDIGCSGGKYARNSSQGEVMRCHQTNSVSFEQSSHYCPSTDGTIMGIRAVQNFVQQEKHRLPFFHQAHDFLKPADLCVKPRPPVLKGI